MSLLAIIMATQPGPLSFESNNLPAFTEIFMACGGAIWQEQETDGTFCVITELRDDRRHSAGNTDTEAVFLFRHLNASTPIVAD
jgi:hypothetical protein